MAKSKRTETAFHQNFLDLDQDPLPMMSIPYEDLTRDDLLPFLDGPLAIGIAPAYSPEAVLSILSIASRERVLLIDFPTQPKNKRNGNSGGGPTKASPSDGKAALQELLQRPMGQVCAFDLATFALALYKDWDLLILNGCDIQSACQRGKNRSPLSAIQFAVGDG